MNDHGHVDFQNQGGINGTSMAKGAIVQNGLFFVGSTQRPDETREAVSRTPRGESVYTTYYILIQLYFYIYIYIYILFYYTKKTVYSSVVEACHTSSTGTPASAPEAIGRVLAPFRRIMKGRS